MICANVSLAMQCSDQTPKALVHPMESQHTIPLVMGVGAETLQPTTKGILISDPRRGCYIVLSMFIFFSFFFFLFFPPRFCPAHISGTVTRRDSKFSVLLGPAV